jgi:hypothetical protein
MNRLCRRSAACLALLLSAQPLIAQTTDALLTPEQITTLEGAEADLRARLAPHADGQDTAAVADFLAVIDGDRLPMPDRLSLANTPCSVRSLQVTADIALGYPFFPCSFRQEGPAGLVFQKDAGSQRRMGLLLPGASGTNFAFRGGSYFTGEAPRGYTGDPEAGTDSLGLMYRGGPDRYYIIFAPVDGRGEVYEILTQ